MEKERRYFTATELRTARTGLSPRIVGHAAVFNQLSEDLGGFREKIAPGAFAETIKTADIRALWNHDPNFPLARTKSGTLSLREDNTGLAIDASLADTTFTRDLLTWIDRGDVDQMSFGFRVMPDGQKWAMEDGGLIRTLTNVELFDVSPVTFPAYPQTDVGIRSLAAEMRKKFESDGTEKRADDEKAKAEISERIKQRQEFLAQRIEHQAEEKSIPAGFLARVKTHVVEVDPLSLRGILNKSRTVT